MRQVKIISYLGIALAGILPLSAYAAQTFAQLVNGPLVSMGNSIILLLFALAFLFFVYGIARYFMYSNSDEARKKGRQVMLWGIIGMAVLFSVWGIVQALVTTLTTWSA